MEVVAVLLDFCAYAFEWEWVFVCVSIRILIKMKKKTTGTGTKSAWKCYVCKCVLFVCMCVCHRQGKCLLVQFFSTEKYIYLVLVLKLMLGRKFNNWHCFTKSKAWLRSVFFFLDSIHKFCVVFEIWVYLVWYLCFKLCVLNVLFFCVFPNAVRDR